MNPQAMNKGYGRLMGGALCVIILSDHMGFAVTGIPAIIGLALCYWGAGFLLEETGSFRFRQIKVYCGAGMVIWLLQSYTSSYIVEFGSWSVRFFFCFIGSVLVLQIFVNVFSAAAELLAGEGVGGEAIGRNSGLAGMDGAGANENSRKDPYYSRCAWIFAIGWTICTLGVMAEQFDGGFWIVSEHMTIALFSALQFVLGIWTMAMIEKLRQQYPALGA